MFSRVLEVLQVWQDGDVRVRHKDPFLRLHQGLSRHHLPLCHPPGCHILLI